MLVLRSAETKVAAGRLPTLEATLCVCRTRPVTAVLQGSEGSLLKLPPRPATLDSTAGHRSNYVEVRGCVCKAAKLSESPPRLVTAVGYLTRPLRRDDRAAGCTRAGSLAACVKLLAVASRRRGRRCLKRATVRCRKAVPEQLKWEGNDQCHGNHPSQTS